jgi:nicotinate-nucleotide adenylyltransferase
MRVGIFPGSFNPPTRAHLALIEAARARVDRVIAILPRAFPHKEYHGATIEQRLAMLEAIQPAAPFSVCTTERGLFIDIAREIRARTGPRSELWFVCGRDAAERILAWDYGRADAVHDMLKEFGLLVAARRGYLVPPPGIAHRVEMLDMPADLGGISSTEVRTRIAQGKAWEPLVPAEIVDIVRRLY